MPQYQIQIYQDGQIQEEFTLDGPVSIGRRDPKLNDSAAISIHESKEGTRLIVVESHVREIPRLWFRVSCDQDSQVAVENLHQAFEVTVPGQSSIAAKETRRFSDEVVIDLGLELVLHAKPVSPPPESSDGDYRRLESILLKPGEELDFFPSLTIQQLSGSSGQAAVDLLKVALQVVQKAAGSDAFFQKAVEATTQIVGLDRAVVLMRADAEGVEEIAMDRKLPDGWCAVAEVVGPGTDRTRCPAFSTNVLARVDGSEKSTVIHDSVQSQQGWEEAVSLQGIHCVVASPILNKRGELIGVLYGDRWTQAGRAGQNNITELEATLVEVLAGAVAGGIARKAEERRRGNLSGFFSPRVADLLASNPDLLVGQDVDISALFCDIRGFSTATEILGPQKTVEWINDVLTELSQCVVDTDGVLGDYVGDELMAMWGAPGDQSDHASRAVSTAIAMLKAIETLRDRWADVLPNRFGAGIGVNTGPARVGNIGSRLKFKYGALGNTVNVASRLQAATKQLGVDCMISRRTTVEAGCTEQARRLAQLSVVGIEETIDVYQIVHAPDSRWESLVRDYQSALQDFEEGRFSESAQRLGGLIQQHPHDRPCRQLLTRVAEQLNEPAAEFSPVWMLTKK